MKKKQLDAVRNSFNQMAHGYGLEPRFLDAVIMLEDETFWRIVGLDDSGRAAKCVVLRSGKTIRKVEPKVIRARDRAGHVGEIKRIVPRAVLPVVAKPEAKPVNRLDKIIIGRPEPSHPESKEVFLVKTGEDDGALLPWRKSLTEKGWVFVGQAMKDDLPLARSVILKRGDARLRISALKRSSLGKNRYVICYTPVMSKPPVKVETNSVWLTRKVEQLVAAGRE